MITLASARQMPVAAALAMTLALIAGADIAEARGSGGGGAPSHGQPPSSVNPVKQGSGAGERRAGTQGTTRKGTNRNGQTQNSNKTTVVISDPSGRVLDRIPGPITSYSAQAVPGGIALRINGNTYTIAGTQVVVKNDTLSTYAAQQGGLSQTFIKGRNGTFTTVLTVVKPPLKGL